MSIKELPIILLNKKEIPDSYKWFIKNGRNTFPSHHWLNCFIDFLWHGLKTSEIQTKYKAYLPNSNIDKKDNNMHINVLLRRFYIAEKQNIENIHKNLSFQQLKDWIINHISNVCRENYFFSHKGWKIQIDNWFRYLRDNNLTYLEQQINYLNDTNNCSCQSQNDKFQDSIKLIKKEIEFLKSSINYFFKKIEELESRLNKQN